MFAMETPTVLQPTADIEESTSGPLLVLVPDTLCQTEVRQITFSFLWIVHNFETGLKSFGHLESRPFFAREVDDTKFRLELRRRCFYRMVGSSYHRVVFPEGIYALEVSLILISKNKFYPPIKSKISIVNYRGEKVKTFEDDSKPREPGLLQKYEFSVSKKALVGNNSEDKLTVHCEVTIVAEFATETRNLQEKDNNQILHGASPFSDFGSFLEHPELSDVTLVAQGKEFFAHKIILAGRSPVFAAMFTHEMEEKAKNKVDIVDLSHEVVSEMLRFIYTGRVLRLETMAADLLVAADKYALKGLVRDCAKALSRNMTVETAAEILVLADKHNLNNLKEKVIDFIDNQSEDVRNTKGWKFLTQNYPHLIMEAFLFRPGPRSPS